MFGLSLTKILFTLLVIVAVWKGFRLLGRLQARARQTPARQPGRSATRRREPQEAARSGQALELEPCPLCGTYVPVGTRCESVERCLRRKPATAPGERAGR